MVTRKKYNKIMENTKNEQVKQLCDEYVKKTPDAISSSNFVGQKRRFGATTMNNTSGTQISKVHSRVSRYTTRNGARSEMINLR